MFIVCFSHLRWDFVYQRPQHLLSRASEIFPVFYVEEPMFVDEQSQLRVTRVSTNVQTVVPLINHSEHGTAKDAIIRLLKDWSPAVNEPMIAWFYTPMALDFLQAFPKPSLIVYDVMDELSAFKNPPPGLRQEEEKLIALADVMFTGGQSLYEAKKDRHPNIHAFPSSIDKAHFNKALDKNTVAAADQDSIPHPRIGFFGVIDERFDIDLIGDLAIRKPEWQFILLGPVVKIDPATLPRSVNIHYLGGKSYNELPTYLAGWDVALIPFAINESTKFISPTKTPEYLAGGVPVVSSPIRDVVDPYGTLELVEIASGASEFEDAITRSMGLKEDEAWQKMTSTYLTDFSWDKTWNGMLHEINNVLEKFSIHSLKNAGKFYV